MPSQVDQTALHLCAMIRSYKDVTIISNWGWIQRMVWALGKEFPSSDGKLLFFPAGDNHNELWWNINFSIPGKIIILVGNDNHYTVHGNFTCFSCTLIWQLNNEALLSWEKVILKTSFVFATLIWLPLRYHIQNNVASPPITNMNEKCFMVSLEAWVNSTDMNRLSFQMFECSWWTWMESHKVKLMFSLCVIFL